MNISMDMYNQQAMQLAKEISENFNTLDVTFDERYNTVYIHNIDMLYDKKLLKLKEEYSFNISKGIFAV